MYYSSYNLSVSVKSLPQMISKLEIKWKLGCQKRGEKSTAKFIPKFSSYILLKSQLLIVDSISKHV